MRRGLALALSLGLSLGCSRRPPAAVERPVAPADRPFARREAVDAGVGVLTAREWARVRRMSPAPRPEPDPTNRVADDPEAARVGYALFHDAALSVDGTVACATCHRPERAFTDGRALAQVRGFTGTRNTPSLRYAALKRWQTWDGAADSLWAQPLNAWENPREHGLDRETLAARLGDRHGEALARVMGRPPRDSLERIADAGKCLAAYVRSLVPTEPAPFDRWVAGDRTAMSDAAVRGLTLFFRVGCVRCHSGPAFSDGSFHAVRFPNAAAAGADHGRLEGAERARRHPLSAQSVYSDDREAVFPPDPTSQEDDGRFLTPSLRGVALTAPYGHAGTVESLEQVVELYAAGGTPAADPGATGARDVFLEPFALNNADLASLVAFLRALTPSAAPDRGR